MRKMMCTMNEWAAAHVAVTDAQHCNGDDNNNKKFLWLLNTSVVHDVSLVRYVLFAVDADAEVELEIFHIL